MRVVVDTNVIISGLRNPVTAPYQVMKRWRQAEIELLSSEATRQELERVLNYPKVRNLIRLSDEEVQQFLSLYRERTSHIEVVVAVDEVATDPTDTIFLSLAAAGSARYIVTGDTKHLLPLKSYRGIEIVSPTTFLALYHPTVC
jgi:putative PIN family toxin of toxin-antitoxin system